MKLKFNLDYQTLFGEEIVLNVLSDNDKVSRHAMTTLDGHTWFCEFSTRSAKALDYYYSVEREGRVERREWMQRHHRIDLTTKSTVTTTYDHWIDLPQDSYLYSAAFTGCVAQRTLHDVPATDYRQTVMLKVCAPRLRSGDRLAMLGGEPALGQWSVLRAVPMQEHCHNEWVAVIDAGKLQSRTLEFKFLVFTGRDSEAVLWETDGNRTVTLPELKDGECVVYELTVAGFPIADRRVAGTVIPVFSLKTEGSFGVGDFGDLKAMIDWVASNGQKALQVLPINDTTNTGTWVDSYPYNSISIYALHLQYADVRQLPELKDVERRKYYAALQAELNALPQIDYERVNATKRAYLHELFEQEGGKMMKTASFKAFFKKNEHWLVPYAAFCYYRDLNGTAEFGTWPDHRTFDETERTAMANARTKEYKKVAFWYFVQFVLDLQMREAHAHARAKGVILKGDIPIGISRHGVEAWVEPKYFNLNGQAGAPPDAFATDGQNWGFPTYNWDEMLKDGCSWWVKRFRKMSEYFDAYRIDHVLGFFRIWEIPIDAVSGLLGQFSPALAMSHREIEEYGFNFHEEFCTKPFIANWIIDRTFGERANEVREKYLDHAHDDIYNLKTQYSTQRKIEEAFAGQTQERELALRNGLMSLVANVLFLRDHKNPHLYHPRIAAQHSLVYEALWQNDKDAFNKLYNDYFYRRNNGFWYREAMNKLPKLVEATPMLVCAEDLGMVPDCVPWVIDNLRILSLEIQTMPKDTHVKFGVLKNNPYRSVSTISTHDMPTMRLWWDEDWNLTQEYYNEVLWKQGPAPHPMPGRLAEQIVQNHLNSLSMLCLLSLQDWLAIDEDVRQPDADVERINIPANPRHYWRYRMHKSIEELQNNKEFNAKMAQLIASCRRK